jgi:hypothetical protein
MKSLLASFLLLSSSFIYAETAICKGKVQALAYHQPDSLYLAVGDSPIMKICSLKEQYFRTSPESCRFIASEALSARALDKEVEIYVDNAPTTLCSQIGAWSGADVRFVSLLP